MLGKRELVCFTLKGLLLLCGCLSSVFLPRDTVGWSEVCYCEISCAYSLNDRLIDFSLTVKAATLVFVSGRSSAISSAKQGKSGSVYNLVKN